MMNDVAKGTQRASVDDGILVELQQISHESFRRRRRVEKGRRDAG
jgi:hypothetical protein